jgi:hypothetical protein
MYRIVFHTTLDAHWAQIEPVRIGSYLTNGRRADRFVTLESDEGPLLRIDLFRSGEECYAFEQGCIWSGWAAIGWGHHVYLVTLKTRQVSDLDLGSYFGHMYPTGEHLLIASAESLFCISLDGSLLWRSQPLGIDGVVVDEVKGGVIHGQGEWDPPGGWQPFSISIQTGKAV